MTDTIFALSSGPPPAAIALVRITGPQAGAALQTIAGRIPSARKAVAVALRDPADGQLLDRALVLWLPGPDTATGEDVAELHLHGGRAVVASIERVLGALPGLRRAEAGEFTRRAFANGRIDLAEAEGLADLLSAETELQRRSALAMASGVLSRRVEAWRERVLGLSATVEAGLDFAEEDDLAELPASFAVASRSLAAELTAWLERPRAEPLREGFRVVLAGPPNTGKSTLYNVLVGSEAAIVSTVAGTTRDLLSETVAIEGMPFRFVDTAGLRETTPDAIEAEGIARARGAVERADLVLWLGESRAFAPAPRGLWRIAAKCDAADFHLPAEARHVVSAVTGEGVNGLRTDLVALARAAMPAPGEAALGARQHALLGECRDALVGAAAEPDPLLVAERLRLARVSLDRLVGRVGTEDMLDALFGRFCIGK